MANQVLLYCLENQFATVMQEVGLKTEVAVTFCLVLSNPVGFCNCDGAYAC